MGFFKKIGKAVKSGVKKYENWEAKAPEREKAKLQKLRKEEKMLSAKAGVMQQKARIRKLKEQQYKNNPFLSGGGFGSGLGGAADPPTVVKKKRKKKKARSKPKRKEVFYYALVFLVLLVGSGAAAKEYTENTVTDCTGRECTKTFYAGQQFVYEDGQYKHYYEANSLKNTKYKCEVKKDKASDPDVDCIDFSYNSLDLDIKGNKAGSIPIKYYKYEYDPDTKKKEKKEKTEKAKTLSFSDKDEIKKVTINDFVLGEELHIGETSTVVRVVLNQTYENVADVRYYNASQGYLGSQLRWNLTAVLSLNVTAVYQCFHWAAVGVTPASNMTVLRVLNQTWGESNNVTDFLTWTTANSTTKVFNSTAAGSTGCIDVTDHILSDHELSNSYSSLRIYATDWAITTDPTNVDDGLSLIFGELESASQLKSNDRENSQAGYDYPSLRVNYNSFSVDATGITCTVLGQTSLRLTWTYSGDYNNSILVNYTGNTQTVLYNGALLTYDQTGLTASSEQFYNVTVYYNATVFDSAVVSCSTQAVTVDACSHFGDSSESFAKKLVIVIGAAIGIIIIGWLLASMTGILPEFEFIQIVGLAIVVAFIGLILTITVSIGCSF